jgi:plasmid stabilization system protein ParE
MKIRNFYKERRSPAQAVESLRSWFQTENDLAWREKALLDIEALYRKFQSEEVEQAPQLIERLQKKKKPEEEPALQIQKSNVALLLERLAGKKENNLTTIPKKWRENIFGNKRRVGDNSPIKLASLILDMDPEDVEREALQQTSMKEFANNLLDNICSRASSSKRNVKKNQPLVEGGSLTAEDLVEGLLNIRL